MGGHAMSVWRVGVRPCRVDMEDRREATPCQYRGWTRHMSLWRMGGRPYSVTMAQHCHGNPAMVTVTEQHCHGSCY